MQIGSSEVKVNTFATWGKQEPTGDNGRQRCVTDFGPSKALTRRKHYIGSLQTCCLGKIGFTENSPHN